MTEKEIAMETGCYKSRDGGGFDRGLNVSERRKDMNEQVALATSHFLFVSERYFESFRGHGYQTL